MARPGSVIRVTEGNMIAKSSSPALLHLSHLFVQTAYQAGHFFTPDNDGLITERYHCIEQGIYLLHLRPEALSHLHQDPDVITPTYRGTPIL